MIKTFTLSLFLCLFLLSASVYVSAQSTENTPQQSLELSDAEGIPVIFKHLPDWELKQEEASLITNKADLQKLLGEKPIFESIEFIGDTEAVTVNYSQGKLLIVEYGTPQAAADTDKKVKLKLSELNPNPPIFYRRIGNYNVFLFDGTDEASANELFGQIKYAKVVRWLNGNPLAQIRAERNFIEQTSSLFIATVQAISLGFGIAIILGVFCGIIFYNIRKKQRFAMETFSDGGGLTRLNLDQLTPK